MNSSKTQQLRLVVAMLCAGTAPMHSPAALADTPTASADTPAATAEPDTQAASELNEVIVTGSRVTGLRAADSPSPIQLYNVEELQRAAGSPDLQNALAQLVPSLTLQAFASDPVLQTKLRGLSPNHVLLLVNGKRRHTTATLAVLNGSPYQGGAGADLTFIPLDAIDHIEVLTDGAAAQYGSDAIAGVINIILKTNSSGGNVNGTWGNYFNTGGNTNDVAGNAGFAPADGAFLSITGENRGHGHSFVGSVQEQVINPAQISTYPNSNVVNVPNYPYLNRIFGDTESHLKTFAVNAGYDFADGTELYAFGTYGDRHAAQWESYRLPNRAVYVPASGPAVYQYPFGFEPQQVNQEKDSAETVGIKGAIAGWKWDLSSTYGVDKVVLSTATTTNVGLFAATGASPTDIYDGVMRATQWTNNIDINRNFDVGLSGPLNIAFGGEFRQDTYQIGAGLPASYLLGGAQGFAGLSPTDSGSHGRRNEAVYVDLAVKPVANLQIDAAGRFEHYTDFGSAKVGKLTARYDFTPQVAVRGTVSNGFRAPTLAEEYYSSTIAGLVSATAQLPPNSPGARQLGLNGLQPEHSVNLSLGLVYHPIPEVSMTLDAYQIQVTNRIVGSGTLYGTVNGVVQSTAVNQAIAANGNELDATVPTTALSIFSNGPDTMTRGVDLVFDYPVNYDIGKIDYSIGASYDKTQITKLPSEIPAVPNQLLYNAQAVSDLTTVNPLYVVNLGATWTLGKVAVNLVEKIYGPTSEYQGITATPNHVLTNFRSDIGVTPITNLDISYQVFERFSLSVGATNLLNRFPNKLNSQELADTANFTYGNGSTMQYPQWSPFGINGGFYYVKGAFKW